MSEDGPPQEPNGDGGAETEKRGSFRASLEMELSLPPDAAASEAAVGGPSFAWQLCVTVLYMLAAMGLNFFMKFCFSGLPLHANPHGKLAHVTVIKGLPAPFFWTVTQQAIAFLLAGCLVLTHRLSGGKCGYNLPILPTWQAWLQVALVGGCFAANIGLNNFSLSLVSLTVNNMIRATTPFTTSVAGAMVSGNKMTFEEWMWVCVGVVFVLINVLAKSPGGLATASPSFALGVTVGFVSCLGGALMLVIVELTGTSATKLNAIDNLCYMSPPAVVLLLAPLLTTAHIVSQKWAEGALDGESYTDMQLLAMVSGGKIWLFVLLSGVLAFLYNALQFYAVQLLSPVQCAFAGNMSKAITVIFSFTLLEEHGTHMQSVLLLSSAAGGLACFTLFSLTKIQNKSRGPLLPGAVRAQTRTQEVRKVLLMLLIGGVAGLLGGLSISQEKMHEVAHTQARSAAAGQQHPDVGDVLSAFLSQGI